MLMNLEIKLYRGSKDPNELIPTTTAKPNKIFSRDARIYFKSWFRVRFPILR
ncbi:uncharacterized protein METZ01_LOCUS241887 [marine metagenome]|uniref:Uncharacterized protein n=1 Tax=marine metagenome TaxID=408172 RepID=A0A382HQX4_9ZZZZ